MLLPIFFKKVHPPSPKDGPAGGIPHFFSKIGDNMAWRGDTLLKKWSKGVFPLLGHFLAILGISGENGVPYWSPRGSKPADKTVHHPSGVISEVLPRAKFVLLARPGPKLALGKTSEMTPRRVVYRFLCALGFPGRPVWHTVFTGNPQNRQKVPQKGVNPPNKRR